MLYESQDFFSLCKSTPELTLAYFVKESYNIKMFFLCRHCNLEKSIYDGLITERTAIQAIRVKVGGCLGVSLLGVLRTENIQAGCVGWRVRKLMYWHIREGRALTELEDYHRIHND